jgi:DNA-binding Lrp family transcriptional regulator
LKYPYISEKSVTRAYVLIKSDLGAEQKIIEELENLEQVLQVEEIFGDYDLIVKLEAEHSIKIREVISWDIKNIKGVRATKTLMKKEQE